MLTYPLQQESCESTRSGYGEATQHTHTAAAGIQEDQGAAGGDEYVRQAEKEAYVRAAREVLASTPLHPLL
jgi:hypothetical protein